MRQGATAVAEAEQQRNAMLGAAVTQLTASAQPRTDILNAGLCNPSLSTPLLFFTRQGHHHFLQLGPWRWHTFSASADRSRCRA
jgi:hypothetical protein